MPFIYVMFFASGAASLIYQVIWFKQLQFVLGSSTFAVSMTVASFFFGLSLGSWLGGKLADRIQRALAAYALLELVLAVVAIVVTLFLSNWSAWATRLAITAWRCSWSTGWCGTPPARPAASARG